MKNTISYILTVMLITFMIVLVVSVINVTVTINKANAYHQTCISEIQASNFSTSVNSKYTGNTGMFKTTIKNKSIVDENENIEKTGRIYEVSTTYTIKIPVINYSTEQVIVGFAR